MTNKKRGLLLGKFMPPHSGHLHLIDFARLYRAAFAEEIDLTVVVGTIQREPIPGALRFEWMRELVGGSPNVRVVHLTDENPQEPSEHPDFWSIWTASLRRVHPEPLDYVFASEPYGAQLAKVLGAEFVPVDPARSGVAISATAIRNDPLTHWDRIPRAVRPHFVKRVVIFGPESTGKSTLSVALAKHFATVAVPEYARTLLEARPELATKVDEPTLERMVHGQIASEDALARSANRVLICDTDPLATTAVWSEVLLGHPLRDELNTLALKRRYDLTLLTDVDIPWVADPIRYRPDDRAAFFTRCVDILDRAKRPWVRIHGAGHDERFAIARQAIDTLLLEQPTSPTR